MRKACTGVGRRPLVAHVKTFPTNSSASFGRRPLLRAASFVGRPRAPNRRAPTARHSVDLDTCWHSLSSGFHRPQAQRRRPPSRLPGELLGHRTSTPTRMIGGSTETTEDPSYTPFHAGRSSAQAHRSGAFPGREKGWALPIGSTALTPGHHMKGCAVRVSAVDPVQGPDPNVLMIHCIPGCLVATTGAMVLPPPWISDSGVSTPLPHAVPASRGPPGSLRP